jgi:hypothetical protein
VASICKRVGLVTRTFRRGGAHSGLVELTLIITKYLKVFYSIR